MAKNFRDDLWCFQAIPQWDEEEHDTKQEDRKVQALVPAREGKSSPSHTFLERGEGTRCTLCEYMIPR